MQGLYKTVLSGMYPKIPDSYSEDLARVIKLLLQVDPSKRPACEQILAHPLVKMHTTDDYGDSEDDIEKDLLSPLSH